MKNTNRKQINMDKVAFHIRVKENKMSDTINEDVLLLKTEKVILNSQLEHNQKRYDERIKEQEMLYNLFSILGTNKYVNYALQSVVEAIPSGSMHAELITARITFGGKEFCSVNFSESLSYLFAGFETLGGKKGTVEVFYHSDEKGFVLEPSNMEGHNLVNAIAKLLRGWLNKYEAENKLRNMLVELESKIEDRTTELRKANDILNSVNKDINDSINYANKMQRAILPTKNLLNTIFDDAFVLYKPKDIVSGDFYWVHQSVNKIFYACADCTGHGVPGALMSMVGNQLLNNIITEKKISDPSLILKEMDEAIVKLFHNGNVTDHLRDGMAMSLCVIDKENKKLSFAGAYNNAYVQTGTELKVLRASRQSVGGSDEGEKKNFATEVFDYKKGDLLYMFTDGYSDQFGGPSIKKFLRKNLLDLLAEMKHIGMDMQQYILEKAHNDWKGDHFQVDDITVLGVKL
jgi:serine phosphatase RsbU (regulator of sigma subunit)